jgi:hypothetical protein
LNSNQSTHRETALGADFPEVPLLSQVLADRGQIDRSSAHEHFSAAHF